MKVLDFDIIDFGGSSIKRTKLRGPRPSRGPKASDLRGSNLIPNAYRVSNWNALYENNRTKEIKRLLWVPVPNSMDGAGYTELVDHPNGAAHFGAWIAILEIASRQEVRGEIPQSSAGTSQALARISRLPVSVFDEVFPRLIELQWVEPTGNQQLGEIPQEGAGKPQEGAGKPPLKEGTEGIEIHCDASPKRSAVDVWFETAFWPKWLRRPDDDLPGPALKAARSVAKTVAIRKQIMAAVEACRADRQEKEPGYRVSARRWLREGMWEVSAVESAKPQELWPGQLGGRPHPDAIMRNFKKGDFIR